jgi:hypothetical protein
MVIFIVLTLKDMKQLVLIMALVLTSLSAISQQLIDKVPFRIVENLIFVELCVNDCKQPLNFLFDSGAGITVVDTKVAEQLLIKVDSESNIRTAGKSLLSQESTSNTIKIGEHIKLDGVNLVLMNLSHIGEYLKTNVDGVIGFDLLNQYIVETHIDYKEVRFYEFNNFIYMGASEPYPLTTLESNLFGVMIEVLPKNTNQPISLNFEVDTGAANFLTFHNKTINDYQLLDDNKRKRFSHGFGADSTITKNMRGKVRSVSFGGKTWKNIPVVFEIDPINSRDNSIADGLIGQELLLDFNITYNLKEQVIYFEHRL